MTTAFPWCIRMTDWPEHLWHNPGSARENGKMAMLDGGESDRQAILRLIEDETAAFWNKDWEAFEKCWVHEPYLRRVGWWSLGGVTYREGWEEFARLVQARFRDNPEPNRSAVEVRRENFNIRVGTDMAWVTYDQYAPDTGEPDMDMPGLSRETLFLEKHDGAWRFAYSCYLFRSVHQESAPLLQVDKAGVVVWRNAGAARELARGCGLEMRARRLHATRRDDDARLQGALRWAASLAEDLESRRGLVPIVMQADADAVAERLLGHRRQRTGLRRDQRRGAGRGAPGSGRAGLRAVGGADAARRADRCRRGAAGGGAHARGQRQHRPHPAAAHLRQDRRAQPVGAGAGAAQHRLACRVRLVSGRATACQPSGARLSGGAGD